MPEYILSPQEEDLPEYTGAQMIRVARQRRIEAALARRALHSRKSDLALWLRNKRLDGKQLGTVERNVPSVTGIELVDVHEDVAEDIKSSKLGYHVTPNMPIPLVGPATTKGPVTDEPDPWHATLVGIDLSQPRPTTGKGVLVAVLDTGIDIGHKAFDGREYTTLSFDGETRQVVEVTAADPSGHGTHVAGILAAKNFGIAPGADILSCIVFPDEKSTLRDLCFAIEWAAQNPDVSIINVSGGLDGVLSGFDTAFAAIKATGVLLVCAIGNEGPGRSRSPGNYRDALAVGAVDRQRKVWAFSGGGDLNGGYSVPDLVAPGVLVSSCVAGHRYQAWSGTSMAAPIVSGVAALILESEPMISVEELVARLQSTCLNLNDTVPRQGSGLVQLV